MLLLRHAGRRTCIPVRVARLATHLFPSSHLPSYIGLLFIALLSWSCSTGERQIQGGQMIPPASERAGAPQRLVVSEFHGSYTLLIAENPRERRDRRQLLRVDHMEHWAPRFAMSPGGGAVAYTVMGAGALFPERDASLWVVDLATGKAKRLATGLDLRTAPLWSPDERLLAVQRTAELPDGMVSIVEMVEVATGSSQALASARPPVRLFPVSYAVDGQEFLFVRFQRDGVNLLSVNLASKRERTIASLGAGVARDFRLSPNGDKLVFLKLEGEPARYHARAVDLKSGVVSALLPDVSRLEDVGVAWQSGQGTITVGTIADPASGGSRVVVTDGARTVSEIIAPSGFDVPVSWSPDGRYLATRAFTGQSADQPGAEQPQLLDVEGVRRPLTGDGPIEVVGWIRERP